MKVGAPRAFGFAALARTGAVCLAALTASAAVFVSPQEKAPVHGAAAVFEKNFANG